ncbi:hypothetical protein HMPREF0290_1049 [Corynebacterium efficiens YS-314]|nr:hypothetical protein HMPREF0290_1049 [Corynebacterium efficiens YS-314]
MDGQLSALVTLKSADTTTDDVPVHTNVTDLPVGGKPAEKSPTTQVILCPPNVGTGAPAAAELVVRLSTHNHPDPPPLRCRGGSY